MTTCIQCGREVGIPDHPYFVPDGGFPTCLPCAKDQTRKVSGMIYCIIQPPPLPVQPITVSFEWKVEDDQEH